MALKRKITKTEYDALPDVLKSEYKEDGDNYILDVEADKSFDALKEEKKREKERADALQAKIDEQEEARKTAVEAARAAAEEEAKAKGDVAALEQSWQEKYDRDIAEAKAKSEKSKQALEAVFVNKVANEMASKISVVPDLLVDRIRERLSVDTTGDVPITRVVDAAGNASALTLADLEKEFVDNPAYKAIIKASDANGGGAGEGGEGGGVLGKKLSEMTATEEAKFANDHPEEYARLVNG